MRGNDNRRLVESFSKDMSLADAFKCLFENASDAIYILGMHGKSFRKIIPAKSLPHAKLEGGEKVWVNVPESLLSTRRKRKESPKNNIGRRRIRC